MAVNERAALDAVLKLADKALQELQGLLSIVDREELVKKLRSLADLFDRLPMLENDVTVLRSRIRGMMSSDPDRTPSTGISTQMVALREKSRGLTAPGGFVPPVVRDTKLTPAPMIPLPSKRRDDR